MTERELVAYDLICRCGAEGKAIYSQNEKPTHHEFDLDERFKDVEGAFVLQGDGSFQCHSCGGIVDA